MIHKPTEGRRTNMAARTLDELQKQYNAKPKAEKRGMPMHGPRGPMGGPMGGFGGGPRR